MKQEITATVVGGGLKLDQPVDLPENSRVCVGIESLIERRARRGEALAAWLEVCERHPVHSGGLRFTRDELHERH
ncbi:MAG: hypothetical protein RBS80_19170 [Thermoguttaceae bacterium]|nr:hypothetical protein [Thermoguttaceae bacterium]